MRRDEILDISTLLVLTTLGVVTRLSFLSQPIRYDEAVTLLNFGIQPLAVGLSSYDTPNNHLLHTLFLHIAQVVFGTEEWAIRIPALVAGTLMIPASYLAARGLYGRAPALLCAALVSSSAILIDYSADARGYTLVGLITLLLVAVAAHLRENWTAPGLVLFAVLAALGLYAVPTMLYAWGPALVWLCLNARAVPWATRVRGLVTSAGLTLGLAALLYAPVVVHSGFKALVMNPFVVPKPWAELVRAWPVTAGAVWHDWTLALPLPVQLATLIGLVVSMLAHARVHARGMPLLGAALLWIVPLLMLQRVVPFERVWLFLLPLCFAAAADGWLVLVRYVARDSMRAKRWLAAGAAMVLGGYLSEQAVAVQLPPHEIEAAAMFLGGYVRSGDQVLAAVPTDWPLRYYFWRSGLVPAYVPDQPPGVGTASRLLVVVDGDNGESLSSVLQSVGLTPTAAEAAAPVWNQDATAIYQVSGK